MINIAIAIFAKNPIRRVFPDLVTYCVSGGFQTRNREGVANFVYKTCSGHSANVVQHVNIVQTLDVDVCQGFFQGGAGGSIRPPLEAGCPPLRGPPITYSYSIIFDIVHVESFPLIVNGISFLK